MTPIAVITSAARDLAVAVPQFMVLSKKPKSDYSDTWHLMAAYLTRRVTFAAAHRYRRADWSEEKNQSVFGRCAWENFHGHSYVCDVTVTGPIDSDTGMIVDLGVLDDVLRVEVRDRFDHRNINLDVPEFADGKLVPTGEELARFIFQRVQQALGTATRVFEVKVSEDATLSASYRQE